MKTDKILERLEAKMVLVKNDDDKAFKRIFGSSGWNGVLPSYAIIERGNVQYLYSSIGYFINGNLAVKASELSPDYKKEVEKGELCAFFNDQDHYQVGYYDEYLPNYQNYPHISENQVEWKYAMRLEGNETVTEVGVKIMRYFED